MSNRVQDLTADQVSHLVLMREIEDFLYMEADLLDEREYDQWLDLLADDMRYWMPLRLNVPYEDRAHDMTAEEDDVAWFNDDKETLIKRVRQLQTGVHWADEPIARVTHLVTNVRLAEPATRLDEGASVKIRCRFIVHRNRLETETDLLMGRREDIIRRVQGGALKIAHRKIILDQSVLLAKNLTMFF